MFRYLPSLGASVVIAMAIVTPSVAAPSSPPPLECHDLDFLIGDWDAATPNGVVVGKVTWEAGPSHCFLKEVWNGQNGSPSFYAVMAYSADAHNWGYFAASPGGVRERWEYGLWQDNELRLETAEPGPAEEHFSYFKLPDGAIRELDVSSKDAGRTWTTNYDVHWTRRADNSNSR
jgi:hypothetical protein